MQLMKREKGSVIDGEDTTLLGDKGGRNRCCWDIEGILCRSIGAHELWGHHRMMALLSIEKRGDKMNAGGSVMGVRGGNRGQQRQD